MKKRLKMVLLSVLMILSMTVTGCGKIDLNVFRNLIEEAWTMISEPGREKRPSTDDADDGMEQEILEIELKEGEEVHFG